MNTSIVHLLIICLLVLSSTNGETTYRRSNTDGSQAWGYVEVRPKAHMFWWYYKSPNRVEDPSNPWPIILWLQGGPGGSGVGIGNFQEIGPRDTFHKRRSSSWLNKADLLFVDSPVGSGYSYVEEEELYVKSDEEAANDLTKLLIDLFNNNQTLNQSPLFIVGQSYGGKIAVKLGLSILKSVESGELKLRLGGVVLGNSWISPEDFVFSWGPLLKYVSRLDDNGLEESNRLAKEIKEQLETGQYIEATKTWVELQKLIKSKSNSVSLYNFMLDSIELEAEGDLYLYRLMNGEIREKLGNIPKAVIWREIAHDVFNAMGAAFMKPVIDEVDELLTKGIDVTIYNGQLDVICSTSGTEAWVHKLKWEGIEEFKKKERKALYCDESGKRTRGFTKSVKNLHFYWILGAGHSVPEDEPCVALKMIGEITKSPRVPRSTMCCIISTNFHNHDISLLSHLNAF